MKYRISISFLLSYAMVALLTSCTLETDNTPEKLEGMWHLVGIESIMSTSSGEDSVSVDDYSGRKIFWSFQAKLLELDDKNGLNASVLYRFEQNDTQLKLKSPYVYDRTNGDYELTDMGLLNFYGIQELTPVYTISVGSNSLTLSSNSRVLRFVKF
jgi:hypothetical protein